MVQDGSVNLGEKSLVDYKEDEESRRFKRREREKNNVGILHKSIN